jgi:hypothetical protein
MMCVVVMFGGEGGKRKGLENGGFMCSNVVMCAVVMVGERVKQRGFYVLQCGDVCCGYGWGRGRELERFLRCDLWCLVLRWD